MDALTHFRGLRAWGSRELGGRPLFSGAVAASVAGALYWCIQDYRFFISLGPGGPPYNVFGWVSVSFFLRPFALSAKDARWTGDYPPSGAHEEVEALPERKGLRPQVGGIAPHRQLNQQATEDMIKQEYAMFEAAVTQNPQLLEEKISHYEHHHQALFVRESILKAPDAKTKLPQTAIEAQGEHGHIHNDGSLHLYFSPSDAKVIIEKGWGERHRLARQQPFYLGSKKYMFGIGPTYLMIYAPRDQGEFAVVKTLAKNSIKFMTGREDIEDF